MKWLKKGLIYGPDSSINWAEHSALQPTPLILDDDSIRVYAGFRDKNGVSRVGFVDVDINNPSRVLKVSKEPVLDIGIPGAFDDNGVVPSAVFRHMGKIYLYYAGYQIGYHVRMTIFCGLAVSEDNGETFKRFSKVPILDRSDDEVLFRVIHSVVQDGDEWKIYYGGGSSFRNGKNKTLPEYDIRYTTTKNGINFSKSIIKILSTDGDEYRVARPYVIKNKDKYKMFFCSGSETVTYKLAYAESSDGVNWKRDDSKLNINLSKSGWDSEMMAYPSVINTNNSTYLFYNGNNYGFYGFGYAELMEE